MNNLVIVAIPDENEQVWKVSSEKIPHLTLLFLGDMDQVSNLEQIVLFVEHAASLLGRFHLSVDRRGELGADQADVLFFKKNRYEYKAIRDFRATLLQENNIKTAYDKATQFDGPWNPHLTLGYPAAPAKPDVNDYGFYSIEFNRIAVWTDDFDGPEFRLKDWWDEYETLDTIPMDVAMSDLAHKATVSDTKWSQFKNSDYTDEQYASACLLDRGENAGTAKQRYGLPVREPNGTLNRNACHAAAAVLSSVGGTGSARGSKVKGTPEQIAKAKKKLVALYKGPLGEDVPTGLGGEDTVKQAVDLGSEFVLERYGVGVEDPMVQISDKGAAFLTHYGVKGQKWGVRKNPQTGLTPGETKREGNQRFLDPQGHAISTDVSKVAIGVLVPVVAPLTWPAQIRLIRGGARGVQKKALDRQEKKFVKNAMSPKNFAAIHNGSLEKVNRDLDAINKKYPQPNKDAKTQKNYDNEVLKTMQDGYRESANSMGNKAGTHHLDVEFKNDGLDFTIHAREGVPTPQPKQAKHAAGDVVDEEITVEITGKIKRDNAGHILGFEFDDLEQPSLAQSVDLGEAFLLEHYGVKGMHWGRRKAVPTAVGVTAVSNVPHGTKRKTKIKTQGGENHPAHEDAIKVAEARAKLTKSGTAALSNKELRDVANRIQLEQQVKQLHASGGKKFVTGLLKSQGQQSAGRVITRKAMARGF